MAETETKDPRKSVKYTVQGTFYNPSSEDKDGKFEETVEGDDMSEDGASTAFYKEHSKNYPHYKIGSIKKVEAEADDTAKKDASPRHDGETARAGRMVRADMISRACDVAMRVADRVAARLDAEESRQDASLSGTSTADLKKELAKLKKLKDEMYATPSGRANFNSSFLSDLTKLVAELRKRGESADT